MPFRIHHDVRPLFLMAIASWVKRFQYTELWLCRTTVEKANQPEQAVPLELSPRKGEVFQPDAPGNGWELHEKRTDGEREGVTRARLLRGKTVLVEGRVLSDIIIIYSVNLIYIIFPPTLPSIHPSLPPSLPPYQSTIPPRISSIHPPNISAILTFPFFISSVSCNSSYSRLVCVRSL